MKVLVVDDNPRNIQIIANLLKELDLQIAFAINGAKALEHAEKYDFDLILLDIIMPGIDGFEVCRRLRMNEHTKLVPIIFLTAKTSPESIVKGFELGANDYLTKPFNSLELLARVKTQLELNEKRKQLDQLNAELENKVAARTFELANANLRLKRLEKSKSDFLSVISHELRTPLTTLSGITSLMQNTSLSPEQHEYLQAIEQASARLVRFSEMALLITSLQTGGGQQPEMFDLKVKPLFEISLFELKNILEEKKIKLGVDVADDFPMLYGDADLIRKCLIILIENAVKHLPEQGRISLEAALAGDGSIRLMISDNGPGFMPDILDAFGVDDDQKPSRNLGALSLTAVKLMMAIHGGKLKIENIVGRGARASLHFAAKK